MTDDAPTICLTKYQELVTELHDCKRENELLAERLKNANEWIEELGYFAY